MKEQKYYHWAEILVEATDDFESRYPGGLKKLQSLTTNDLNEIQDLELSKLYNEASKAIVEPDRYSGIEDKKNLLEEYHKLWDKGSNEEIVSCAEYMLNKQWKHIFEIVIYYGY